MPYWTAKNCFEHRNSPAALTWVRRTLWLLKLVALKLGPDCIEVLQTWTSGIYELGNSIWPVNIDGLGEPYTVGLCQ